MEDITSAMRKYSKFRRNRTLPTKWIFWYIFMVFKRALRFIPLYFIILVFEWKMLPYLASGPIGATDLNCTSAKLLPTLFFFNTNYAGTDAKMCSPWLWYLAADIQCFLLVPILVLVFRRYPKQALSASAGLALACTICTFWIC